MRKIKVILSSILVLTFAMFGLAAPASAQVNFKIPNPSKYNSLEDVINALASLIRPLFLITFGAMILVGAFLLLTSQGDEEKIANSKKTITAAIIGFTIAVLAPTIAGLVVNFLGVDGFSL